MKIYVASENPVKINSVREAFLRMFPEDECIIKGMSASSDVSDQPMSDEETYEGALSRVNNLSQKVEADYWVGIEAGIQEKNSEFEVFIWVVIKNKNGKYGKGRSATYFLPESVNKLLRQGMELTKASGIIFKENDLGRKQGTIGVLTNNAIDRTKYGIDPVIIALIPFKNNHLY